ncbi:DUF1236 domain-containing protein [Phyllobacterium lublinensis]|uniref:DUF1236 domain-containing protein n=1 Tax=Phyllobacterium lublinensis TaxID=2875708 RepID=UPI001CCCF4C0|nr:DUF1236 domain-containing protein [Phyllobacterium sp. 2063]MBZ9655018.1 DUF1236 domain-containing protein [Phyllobacterium sp. 2063]
MKKVLTLAAAALLATSGLAIAQDSVIIEVPQRARDYVIAHPADPVVIEGNLSQGYVVPQGIVVRPIPESPGYGYIYVDGRPVIVSLDNRQVVYLDEPARGVPDEVITYVERNPVDAVMVEGPIDTGTVIPEGVPLVAVPDQPRYSYVYVEGRPALVDNGTRRVVWVR